MTRKTPKRWPLLGALALLPTSLAAVEVSVDGTGWLQNLTLKSILKRSLELPQQEHWNANMIEDAMFFLEEQMRQGGYLEPTVHVALFDAEGTKLEDYTWSDELQLSEDTHLPEAQRAEFRIEKGLLFYFDRVAFTGSDVIEPDQARLYFHPAQGLIGSKSDRPYNESILGSGVRNLTAELEAIGYQEANVMIDTVDIDTESGAVSVDLAVEEGPRYWLTQVEDELAEGVSDDFAAGLLRAVQDVDQAYSASRARDYATALRNIFYANGYPGVEISLEPTFSEPENERVDVTLDLVVKPGPRTRLGAIALEGFIDTEEEFVRSNITVEEGQWLNRLALEDSRDRLARLGAFTRMRYRLEPMETDDGEAAQRAVFMAEEVKQQKFSLLLGWGSYEMLRVGFIYQYRNLWGRAHSTTFQALQTFKSSAARWQYAIPETRAFAYNSQFSLYGITREEVSFDREEYGAEAGVYRELEDWDSRYSLVYRLEQLTSRSIDGTEIPGDPDQLSASIAFEWATDQRNSLLSPDSGIRWTFRSEFADEILGAQERYQLWGGTISWQRPITSSWRLRVGFQHEALTSFFGDREASPFNQRMFPGGENSIRGYTEGKAAPRNSEGTFIGAETISLLSTEVQRRFYKNIYMVFFADQLLQGENISSWPGDQYLASAGAGLRMMTPLGPLRFEYGHNLNKRESDPNGAFHFSIGYPF
ncbi:MAG: BamA/TamA family outer membrane protein [Verrucomicrobiota bacterium JB022]|nr:BamA/TamA family outer membrane protein [Verrucomicrobiota bacterium JB022]